MYFANSKSEAAALVESWLAQNNTPTLQEDTRSHGNPTSYRPHAEHLPQSHVTEDYVMRLNWDEGHVTDDVQLVLSGLRETKIKLSDVPSQPRRDDPLMNMQMRHELVRKRRKERDHAHMAALREERHQEEIKRRARELMRIEEEERRNRERREEEEIQAHMRNIRKQVKEQREKEKAVKMLLEKEEREEELAAAERRKKRIKAAEKIPIETRGGGGGEEDNNNTTSHKTRDITMTRMTLVKQLTEAETIEKKNNLTLLRRCFVVWYGLVTEQLAVRKRAEVIGNWRILSHYWRRWRNIVRENKAKRLALEETERLRRERKVTGLADEHYKLRLLWKCLVAWRGVVSAAKLYKAQSHEKKISNFLQAIAASSSADREKENSPSENEKPNAIQLEPEDKEKPVGNNESRRGCSKGVWSTARAHLDKVLAEGTRRANATRNKMEEHEEVHESGQTDVRIQSRTIQTHSHATQPQTGTKTPAPEIRPKTVMTTPPKPLLVKKMEERAALMAERKLAREERRKRREQELKEEMEAKEKEKQKEEREAKRAEAQKRLEEKKAAEEKERQKQIRAQHFASLQSKANAHYQRHLLRHWGISPWAKFNADIKKAWKMGVAHNEKHCLTKTWVVWKEKTNECLRLKNEKSHSFLRLKTLQRVFKAWKVYVEHQNDLMKFAVKMNNKLLLHKVLSSWERVTREERISYWEKERRARKHYENHLMVMALLSWRSYVPISLEEKEQEVRRAELRRKVAQWLPDYQPINLTEH